MNKMKYSPVEIVTINIQKHIDIIAKEVSDQEKRNSSDGDIGEEDVME